MEKIRYIGYDFHTGNKIKVTLSNIIKRTEELVKQVPGKMDLLKYEAVITDKPIEQDKEYSFVILKVQSLLSNNTTKTDIYLINGKIYVMSDDGSTVDTIRS